MHIRPIGLSGVSMDLIYREDIAGKQAEHVLDIVVCFKFMIKTVTGSDNDQKYCTHSLKWLTLALCPCGCCSHIKVR